METEKSSRLSPTRVVIFGLGHVLNDMCASMWFTYLLIFAKGVLGFSGARAGNLMLIGQVTDAICTPLVGMASDSEKLQRKPCLKYGRKKSWHFIGFICVTGSFPFIFTRCIACEYGNTSEWLQLLYYVPFVVLFQFGWACMQVTHLALIPALSEADHQRTKLSATRNAAAVVANIIVFALIYVFLGIVAIDTDSKISSKDNMSFEYAAYIVTCVGFILSVIFYAGTNEPKKKLQTIVANGEKTSIKDLPSSNDKEKCDTKSSENKQIARWSDWFYKPDFYLVGLIYMATRLYANVTQAYLPLYITDTQNFDKEYIAIIPLTMYISSFIASVILGQKAFTTRFNRKILFLCGLISASFASIWMYFPNLSYQIYGVSVFIGFCTSILMINAFGFIAELIGTNTAFSAFVYGCMSFLDKLVTGSVIQIIQQQQTMEKDANRFYRDTIVYASSGALLIALLPLIIIWCRNVREKRVIDSQADTSENGVCKSTFTLTEIGKF